MKTKQGKRNSTKPFKTVKKNQNVEIHLQAGPCTSPPYNQFNMVCNNCAEDQPCSFMGLRGFEISTTDGSLVYGPYFPETKKQDLLNNCRSLRFNGKPYSPSARKYALNQIRSTLRKVLDRQKLVRSHNTNVAIQRDHVEGYRHLCDICFTSIFNHHYVCAYCAMEICIDCYDSLNNTTHGLHRHPNSSNQEHAKAEFVLFSKFSKQTIAALYKTTTSKAGLSIKSKARTNDDRVVHPMPSTSLGHPFISQSENSNLDIATGSEILHDNQLLCDTNVSIEFPNKCNSLDMTVTESSHLAIYNGNNSTYYSQLSTSFETSPPITEPLYLYNNCTSPHLMDIAATADQMYIASSNSIDSAPLLSDSLYSSDQSNVASCSPTFRPTDEIGLIDYGTHNLPSGNDYLDFATPWNPNYERSNILDNIQINLSTYDYHLLQHTMKQDDNLYLTEYYPTNDYALFENNLLTYQDSSSNHIQQDDLYHTNYSPYPQDNSNTHHLESDHQSTDLSTQDNFVHLISNEQRFTSADLRDTSDIVNLNYNNASNMNVLDVHEEIKKEISNDDSSASLNLIEHDVKLEPCSTNLLATFIESTQQAPYIKQETNDKTLGQYEDISFTRIEKENASRVKPIVIHQYNSDKDPTNNIYSGDSKCEQESSQENEFLMIEASNLTLEIFQQEWQTHRPIQVTHSTSNSQFEWTPTMFSKLCGSDMIQATDHDHTVYELQAKDYFNAFSDRKRRQRLCNKLGSSQVLKVKDWPQTQDLQNKIPGLYDDFMRTVPAPEYCSASGYLNLANRLPEEYLPPDLGPKMFISYGSDTQGKTGETNLHCDITDAVNVMYYADDHTNMEKPKSASIWHIFPHHQLDLIQAYIKKYKDCQNLHPIFDHAFYLTENDLDQLKKEFGVIPFTIYQNPGDAVFIPAGCAHQVLNCSNSIKCAFDFLSPENVDSSLYISTELRKLHKSDALQVQTTLAFSWVSLRSD